MTIQAAAFEKLTADKTPTETTVRPDGSIYKVWRHVVSVAHSQGAGAQLHRSIVIYDSRDLAFPCGPWSVVPGCSGRFGSRSLTLSDAPVTCAKCLKTLAKE